MSAIVTLSNNFILEHGKGKVDFLNGEFRILLMKPDFSFNKNSHKTWANIKAFHITTGNGYPENGRVLQVKTPWSTNESTNITSITWNNLIISTDGGDIGPIKSGVIIQWNTGTPDDSIVIAELLLADVVLVEDGLSFRLDNLGIHIRQTTS